LVVSLVVWYFIHRDVDKLGIMVSTLTTSEVSIMRKLTPEQREVKKLAYLAENAVAEEHTHDENCGHLEVAPVAEEAPSAEVPTEDASPEEAPADDKPKRKSTKKADAEETSEEV